MSFAPLNSLTLTLTDEKATLEFTRTLIDARRQTLAFQKAEISTQLQSKMAKYLSEKDQDADNVTTFNMAEFQYEFDAQQEKLNAQDKILEMERTNLDTKLETITTSLESVEKQLNKNVESEFKSN